VEELEEEIILDTLGKILSLSLNFFILGGFYHSVLHIMISLWKCNCPILDRIRFRKLGSLIACSPISS